MVPVFPAAVPPVPGALPLLPAGFPPVPPAGGTVLPPVPGVLPVPVPEGGSGTLPEDFPPPKALTSAKIPINTRTVIRMTSMSPVMPPEYGVPLSWSGAASGGPCQIELEMVSTIWL